MDNREQMKNSAYKKDKEIKKTTLEIQNNIDKIKEKIEEVNEELKRDG